MNRPININNGGGIHVASRSTSLICNDNEQPMRYDGQLPQIGSGKYADHHAGLHGLR